MGTKQAKCGHYDCCAAVEGVDLESAPVKGGLAPQTVATAPDSEGAIRRLPPEIAGGEELELDPADDGVEDRFEVVLTKTSAGEKFGITPAALRDRDKSPLVLVASVEEASLVAAYNKAASLRHQLRRGDLIWQVNGIEGTPADLVSEMGNSMSVTLQVIRLTRRFVLTLNRTSARQLWGLTFCVDDGVVRNVLSNRLLADHNAKCREAS